MEMLFIESKTPNYTGRSKYSVRGIKTFFSGQKREFRAGHSGTAPQRKKAQLFSGCRVETGGLVRDGDAAEEKRLRYAQPTPME